MKAFFGKKYVFLLCFLAGLFTFSGYSIYNKQEVFIGFAEEISSVSDYDQMDELLSDMVAELQEQEDITADAFNELYGVSQRILGKREYRNFSYVRGDSGMIYYGAVMDNKNDMRWSMPREPAKRRGVPKSREQKPSLSWHRPKLYMTLWVMIRNCLYMIPMPFRTSFFYIYSKMR